MRIPFFKNIINFCVEHPYIVILATVMITVVMGYNALNIRINPDIEGLVPEDEKTTQLIEKYTGGDRPVDYVILCVQSPDLFNLTKLQVFDNTISQLESLPQMETSINPFNNITFQRQGRRLEMVPLAPEKRAPRTDEELETFKRRIVNDPFSEQVVISKKDNVLCAIFPVNKMEDQSAFKQEVKRIVSDLERHYSVYISGTPIFVGTVKDYLIRDMSRLIILAIVVILLIYYFGFHALRAPFLALFVVVFGTVWCLGFMAIFGYTITIVSIITPPLVLSLGSSYTIHILNQYFREVNLHHAHREKLSKRYVADTVFTVNKTILMAAITTIIGLCSLLATRLLPTREFGIVTSVGIFSCALLSFTFLPAVLRLLRAPSEKQNRRVVSGFLTEKMGALGRFVYKAKVPILIFLIVIIVISIAVFNKLEYKTDVISYFPKREKVVQDTNFISRTIGGSQQFYLTLTAPNNEENYFLQKEVLQEVAILEKEIQADKDVTKTLSFVRYLEHLNGMLFGENSIPEKKSLIMFLSRYFRALLKAPSTSSEIQIMVNSDFSRITISMWVYDSENDSIIMDEALREFSKRIQTYADEHIGQTMSFELWGEGMRFLTLPGIIQRDQRVATALSLLFVLLFTAVAFRSLKYGLLALLPLVTGIMLNVIFMVVIGIPMDMTTVMFSIVVIGVGVDNSIHYLIQFRRQRSINPQHAVSVISNALMLTGRPIVITTSSIVIGFLVLTLASFKPIQYFGLLVALALSAAAIGTLIVLPAVLSFGKKEPIPRESRDT